MTLASSPGVAVKWAPPDFWAPHPHITSEMGTPEVLISLVIWSPLEKQAPLDPCMQLRAYSYLLIMEDIAEQGQPRHSYSAIAIYLQCGTYPEDADKKAFEREPSFL